MVILINKTLKGIKQNQPLGWFCLKKFLLFDIYKFYEENKIWI